MLDQSFHVLGEMKLRKMLPDELKVTLVRLNDDKVDHKKIFVKLKVCRGCCLLVVR